VHGFLQDNNHKGIVEPQHLTYNGLSRLDDPKVHRSGKSLHSSVGLDKK
jgi:hypothetical protein